MTSTVQDLVGLSLRARKTLAFLGFTTPEEFNAYTGQEHLKKRGLCGKQTLRELHEWSGYDEYLERRWIEEKCAKAARFLELHGYTVIKSNARNHDSSDSEIA